MKDQIATDEMSMHSENMVQSLRYQTANILISSKKVNITDKQRLGTQQSTKRTPATPSPLHF